VAETARFLFIALLAMAWTLLALCATVCEAVRKALLPWPLAREAGVGAFNDAGIKMEESKCLKQFSTG
jgi:hypothetical protein